MKISLPHVLLGLGSCCAFTQLIGCMPMAGTGTFPNGYPGQPTGIYNPQPYPGGGPWHPVGYPRFPGGPGIPVVMNPTPSPGTTPAPPNVPLPNPGKIPTIPIGHPAPAPAPSEPKDDSTAFWSPWPLPPRGNQSGVRAVGFKGAAAEGVMNPRGSRSSGLHDEVAGSSGNYVRRQQLIEDASPTPKENLKYRGGRIIRDLFYVNLYVSGDTEWSAADVERIDGSLSAAMRDEHLNNVLLQYFNNQHISSTALPSHPLVGYTPKTVSRGDIQNYVTYLHQKGFLRSYDLKNTVFNFLLPPGTVLTADDRAAKAQHVDIHALAGAETIETHNIVPEIEVVDSLNGLGGYHGSVVIANGGRIYFSVDVHSQRFANGATNGIPVFNEPWKNVVATLYHQLVEARTDPDVEDAIRDSSDLNADRYLGWVSDSGLEIGDFPIHANVPITSVVREVPLADGSGMVPVQLPYSNFVQGPEGPIPQPHPLP
ncbi:MAG: hypothetical protein WKF77_24825 [Planctomycetaceae bacterium]